MAKIGFLLLSGGKSTRMGAPKALLEVNGRTLLHAVAQAGEGFETRILSANDASIPTPQGLCAARTSIQAVGRWQASTRRSR